jgi:L-lactate dehydrogenase complex protein LldG
MQKYKQPDSAALRDTILRRLKKNSDGRRVRFTGPPAVSFVQKGKEDKVLAFCENLRKVSGIPAVFSNNNELKQYLTNLIADNGWRSVFCEDGDLMDFLKNSGTETSFTRTFNKNIDAAITGCESLVADLGSVLVSSAQAGSRQVFAFTPVHIVVSSVSQIETTSDTALSALLGKYGEKLPSFISIITGPSRTADIEKTLILGAHGPKVLYVLISEKDFLQNI